MIVIAIYHMSAKVVSRGAGRSAVAASAYLSCSRMYNDYDGVQHDYTRKQGLIFQEVLLPPKASPEWKDREQLWNAVERAEKTKDSRLAREFVVALPIELPRKAQISLLRDFIQNNFVDMGMCADFAIHDTDGHNPHAHILLTVRPLETDGTWQYKTQKEYLCIRNGEEKGFTASEFKDAQTKGWEKQYPYKVGKKKVYMTPSAAQEHGYIRADKHPKSTRYGRQNPLTELWNSEEQIFAWRKSWEMIINEEQERHGIVDRVDCRSHAARGLTEQPTVHEGYHARKLESMGIVSDRCELNRQIRADNKLLRELKASVKKLMDAAKNTIPSLAKAMESLRAKMIIFCYQLGYICKGKSSISKYVDAADPILERYAELKQEIREKSSEQKSLRSEKKGTSIFNVKKQMELSQRIAELTEDLEELCSERTMLLNQLDCADDKEVKKVKTSVSTMKDTLKNLEAKEVQFSAELDAAQKEFASLQEQVADFDPIDLYNARQAIRSEMEQDAVHKLQERYTDEYSYITMVDGRREVSLMLDEYAEEQRIQQLKQEQQRKFQQERRQNHPLKKQKDRER